METYVLLNLYIKMTSQSISNFTELIACCHYDEQPELKLGNDNLNKPGHNLTLFRPGGRAKLSAFQYENKQSRESNNCT